MIDDSHNLDLLMNVGLGVTAELGRCSMRVADVLKLGPGSIVELDRGAGAPVDVFINQRLVARGEIVSVDERYGVRLTEIVARKSAR